ncbi:MULTISPECIES: alpha/beta hydrolase [unclassified Thioalkalivibrio]|uniref:alpha/beta hydrolase n=1 Tax=unclassified Thioalkalivibrio TaxID=2621013 RepID=UPI000377A428|nr:MULTISPECIES: alpha/beta hydrolase [unclassified Thioalkalivibrio]
MVNLFKILALAGLGYVLFTGLIFLTQDRLIYMPSGNVTSTPERIGLAYEDIELVTEDGVRLHGWFVPGPDGDTPVLLFLHGNAGNIGHRLHSLQQFHELGLAVLIIDYRGYGRSAGRPDEAGTYADARAAWQYLTEDRAIPPEAIVVFGRSLGAAVAAELATGVEPAAVILESAFTSAADLGARHYPWLPVRTLLRHEYDTLGRIEAITAPILLAHSRDDEIVPFEHTERLYAAAGDARLLEMEGGHNDAFLATGQAYRDGLQAFLRDAGVRVGDKP